MTLRTTGFRLLERALPRTVENLRAVPDIAAETAATRQHVEDLETALHRLETVVKRQHARLESLERGR